MFAQESVKTEDVARELQAVRAAIGSGEEVERFAKAAFQAYHAVISENGNVKIDLSEVPAPSKTPSARTVRSVSPQSLSYP
jgi:hypothetical protein